MEQSSRSHKQEIIAIIAILIIVGALVVTKIVSSKKDTPTTSSATTTSRAVTPATGTAAAAVYKDGDYQATGNYDSPGGEESIAISVTLKDGAVVATSATSKATDDEAQEYQQQFISGYKQSVIGKAISELSLSRVSGSSLTSQGFNDAIDQIKQQAKA